MRVEIYATVINGARRLISAGAVRPGPDKKNATVTVVTVALDFEIGAPSGFRTPDPLIKSQLLYQLS